MKTHRCRPYPCPYCSKVMDAASGVNHEHAPKPNDITVCVYCSGWLVYGDELELKEMTFEEFDALPAETRGRLQLIRQLMRKHPPPGAASAGVER